MIKSGKWILLGLAHVTLGGCSGGSSVIGSVPDGGDGGGAASREGGLLVEGGQPPEGGTDGVSADQAATDTASAYCARVETCAPAYLVIAYGNVATCEARFKFLLLPQLSASGTSETPARAEACAQAVPQISCADLLARNGPAVCRSMPGTLSNGAACAADSQCVGTRCRVAMDQVCGTCAEPAPAGGSCGVDDDCAPAMKCVGSVCVPYGNENATCDAGHPCRPDLGCIAGTCTVPGPAGTPCTDSAQCDGIHGVICNGSSKRCETASFSAPGGACGLVGTSLVLCSGPGAKCGNVSPQTFRGTCLAPAADGAPCHTENGPLCAGGAACVCTPVGDAGCGGTCAIPDPATCH